jgi:hypothetical protein
MKARSKKLERAKAELFSVSMSKIQTVSSAQQLMVQRAKHAVEEAQQKLAMLKKWDREIDNRSEPLVKQVDQFQSFVATEMPRAIAYLTEVIKTLEAYAEIKMGGGPGAAPKIEEKPSEAGDVSNEGHES